MFKFIWLVPLLPLIGCAINGIFGRWLRFSEKLIGGLAVGSVALSFLISVAAVYSYGFGGDARWPNPFVTEQTVFTWIPGGAVRTTLGSETRAAAAQRQGQRRPVDLDTDSPRTSGATEQSRGSLLN